MEKIYLVTYKDEFYDFAELPPSILVACETRKVAEDYITERVKKEEAEPIHEKLITAQYDIKEIDYVRQTEI